MTKSLPSNDAAEAWYTTAFGDDYLTIYGHRSSEEAERQIDCIMRMLPIPPSSRVLDCACGNGRHVKALLKRNITTIGADLSSQLLAASAGLFGTLPLVRHDMRALPFEDSAFDVVLLLFTSFGYFSTEEEHLLVLREIRRVLRTEGKLLLDLMNPEHTLNTLVPESSRSVQGLHITERRRYEATQRRVIKEIEIAASPSAPSRRYLESVRVFAPEELVSLLVKSGFATVQQYGDFEGSALSSSSPRLITIASSN